jgi:hypothetical protein
MRLMITVDERRCPDGQNGSRGTLDLHLNAVINSGFAGIREGQADRCSVLAVELAGTGQDQRIDGRFRVLLIDRRVVMACDGGDLEQMEVLTVAPIDFQILP